MNTRGIAAVVLSFLLGLGSPALAQNYAPESLDRYFRVEWQSVRSGAAPSSRATCTTSLATPPTG